MARPAIAVATDPQSGDDVRVSGAHYSINGSEPQRVPANLRGLDEMAIAREILRRHLSFEKLTEPPARWRKDQPDGKVDNGNKKEIAG